MSDAGKIVITPKGKYNSKTTYEWLDEVAYDGKSYIALKTVTGVTPSDDGVNWRLFLDPNDIVAGNLVPTFTEASKRNNIISGENLSTILGKVKKYFTDLKGHAFNDPVNNLTTSTTGSVLDASQGKVLKDEVNEINRNLDTLDAVIFNVNGRTSGEGFLWNGAYGDCSIPSGNYVLTTDCNNNTNGNFEITFYDDSKTKIVSYIGRAIKRETMKISIPINASYVRIYFNVEITLNSLRLSKLECLVGDVEEISESLDIVEESAITNLAYSDITTKSSNGITITKNQDGTFTLNGTATSNAGLNLYGFWGLKNYNFLEKSKYTMYLDGNTNENVTFQVYAFNNGNSVVAQTARGNNIKTLDLTGVTFDGLLLYIGVSSGTTLDNYVIKPMLVKGENSIPFVPCIGQSSRLVEEVVSIKNDLGGLSFSVSGTTLSITDGTNTWTLSQ